MLSRIRIKAASVLQKIVVTRSLYLPVVAVVAITIILLKSFVSIAMWLIRWCVQFSLLPVIRVYD